MMDYYAMKEFLMLHCDDLEEHQAETIAYAFEDNAEYVVKILGWEVVDDVQSTGIHGLQSG